MLVKELISNLERMDENSTVNLQIETRIMDEENVPTFADVQSIEFSNDKVILKGKDQLIEWE